jgi:phosphoenolpyruvate carboxykinase (ATP)
MIDWASLSGTNQTTTLSHAVDQDLSQYGFRNLVRTCWNFEPAQLIETAVRRREGLLASNGALVVRTGQFTGRSPKDKYVVRDQLTEGSVNWGAINQPMSEEAFNRLYARLLVFLEAHELFVQDAFGGTDPEYRLPIRVITATAWHSLFARQLFVRPQPEELVNHRPEFTLISAPEFTANPAEDGTRSETCIVLNFSRRLVVIAGTMYAGEMKKSVFTILNYLLPAAGVLPMHCSANSGEDGRTALFFGLSGTGKTTLSADPTRRLIGDDEHGWTDSGIFNFEGGCYAKTIRLSSEKEPQIYNAIRFGTVLENVALDTASRALDYDSEELTENTRAAYPVDFIDNAIIPGVGGHPNVVLFLTADAFGVLPPISKLTPEQAMYHFLSGYTAKLAGTERGLGKEPVPNFSACFGEPFLPRHPQVYARMLGDKLRQHNVPCWLVNTGWIRGPFGIGERISLRSTRAMVNAAIAGKLDRVQARSHPVFGVLVPASCPGIEPALLDARGLWADRDAYDRAARELAARFVKNFEKFGAVDEHIAAAGPRV